MKQEKALDAYYALQQKVSDAASNDNESLAGAEQAAGVKAVETGWFGRDNLPEELNFKPVSDAIFNGGLVGENGTPAATLTSLPSTVTVRSCCASASTSRKRSNRWQK